jgi:DNA-binding PadR family transcriptional regulator
VAAGLDQPGHGPKDGYAIMTDVAVFSGVRMEPGTLYGALARLERRGWIRPSATAGTPPPV